MKESALCDWTIATTEPLINLMMEPGEEVKLYEKYVEVLKIRSITVNKDGDLVDNPDPVCAATHIHKYRSKDKEVD